MDELLKEIQANVKRCRRLARLNYRIAYCLFGFAILSSVVTTIAVAMGRGEKELLAVLTAIPAVILLVNNTFKFELRSRWHWKKTRRLESLFRALKYREMTMAEAAENLSKIEQEMDEEWPALGPIPEKATDLGTQSSKS